MRVYFSGLGGAQPYILEAVKALPVSRALVSFFYKQQTKKLDKWEIDSLFLDSGAYSAYNSGVDIDHDAFLDYALENDGKFDAVASLDVLDDPGMSYRNFVYARSRGLDVWPTWHFGEPEELLRKYLDLTDHICVGGVAGTGVHKDSIKRNLHWLFSTYPGQKVHVFGVNSFDVLMTVPVYSCDALTWRSGSRFGDAFIGGTRFKVGKSTDKDSVYRMCIDHLREKGVDIENPDFDWKELDLYNLREIYDMLEVRHAEIDFSNRVVSEVLF